MLTPVNDSNPLLYSPDMDYTSFQFSRGVYEDHSDDNAGIVDVRSSARFGPEFGGNVRNLHWFRPMQCVQKLQVL